jgi:dihydroorotase
MPPLQSREDIESYRDRILSLQKREFKPYMTIFFSNSYTEEFLSSISDLISAVKLYPSGVTTNSENGVKSLNLDSIGMTLSAMEKLGIPLAVHGESDGSIFEREAEFIPIYEMLAESFPDLKIIMEHISDHRTIELLDKYQNLYATVTVHHLTVTAEDLLGGSLKPHLFCKPIVKFEKDRDALQKLVFSGHPKVMFGSDSAPHLRRNKESKNGSAGIFSAPVLLQKLTELFYNSGNIDKLQAFVSDNAQRIYNITPPERVVTLQKNSWFVEEIYDGVVPLFADREIEWEIVEDTTS